MTTSSNFIRLVGIHLRMVREAKGIKQEWLAEKAGIARARISEIENGKGNATLGTVEKIMDALEITPVELFNFQYLSEIEDITDKKLLIDIHRSVLLERDLVDVQYVVNMAKDFIRTVDKKSDYGKK
ncbi:helix-turn-helix domain-containing protein [Sporosarcina highlanderae]|uniref:Helix-turn-helix transcriptional regulator n=1 Tax=Sporosarcina highlanderae TaxID=3035916 RepID=A0ABT8JT62_9BACL|nr:helix-turn-helix transcriptional regulator [Sporosarcina highlanderae]MDN4608343.1 helix-turn-helix transcriptional regulator [Sporosarcina highlanderae]